MTAPVLGELWAVAGVAGPLDVRILIRGISNYSRSVGNTPVMLVTDGVPPDGIIIQNLGVSPIEFGVDRGLSFGQGIRVPARSQWSPVGGVQSIWASPNYYDRNPLTVVFSALGVRPPFASATQWSYTVPLNRKAWLEQAFVALQRVTAAAVFGSPLGHYSEIFITPAAGGVNVFLFVELVTNGVGDLWSEIAAQNAELNVNDQAWASQGNNDTGGSSLLAANAKLTEFDA